MDVWRLSRVEPTLTHHALVVNPPSLHPPRSLSPHIPWYPVVLKPDPNKQASALRAGGRMVPPHCDQRRSQSGRRAGRHRARRRGRQVERRDHHRRRQLARQVRPQRHRGEGSCPSGGASRGGSSGAASRRRTSRCVHVVHVRDGDLSASRRWRSRPPRQPAPRACRCTSHSCAISCAVAGPSQCSRRTPVVAIAAPLPPSPRPPSPLLPLLTLLLLLLPTAPTGALWPHMRMRSSSDSIDVAGGVHGFQRADLDGVGTRRWRPCRGDHHTVTNMPLPVRRRAAPSSLTPLVP